MSIFVKILLLTINVCIDGIGLCKKMRGRTLWKEGHKMNFQAFRFWSCVMFSMQVIQEYIEHQGYLVIDVVHGYTRSSTSTGRIIAFLGELSNSKRFFQFAVPEISACNQPNKQTLKLYNISVITDTELHRKQWIAWVTSRLFSWLFYSRLVGRSHSRAIYTLHEVITLFLFCLQRFVT